MFKKAADAKSHQRLSGADRKKLRRTIRDRFPNASDAQLDLILPPKAELTVSKYPNRVLVYGVEGDCPMFFDLDGRGHDIFPTVYALWKVPELLPAFVLKGGEVSRFVMGGADLMFPGINIPGEGFPSFRAGEPWAVKVPGNPAPIAVGTTTMSSTEALKAGLRGKALKICHYYRDTLWESSENRHVPNAGFLEDVVFEDPSVDRASDDPSVDPGYIEGTGEVIDAVASVSSGASYVGQSDEVTVHQLTDDVGELKVHVDDSNTEGQPSLSIEEVDVLLDKSLLQALHSTFKEKDLPFPASTLWSNHVLPCRPPGITLDIKKSSHKKLSKWLQTKASGGLITVKEDKHKKEVTLLSVNRKHPDYLSFKPEKLKRVEETTDDASNGEGTLEVSEVYKPSAHVYPIFTSVGADTSRLYAASEASEIVFQYVEKENLVKPSDKCFVTLDVVLCDALFKGVIKKGSTYPTEIHKKDLGQTLISRMQAHHYVRRGNDRAVRKGGLKPMQIMTERRQGNKKVTKLCGMESFLLDAEALASELQKKFACSTTVARLPGMKGQEVLVQGGVIDDLARYLVDHYGVPKKYIEVLDKTKR